MLTGNQYNKGDLARCSLILTDTNGDAVAPTGLTFEYKGPDGVVVTLVKGVDGALATDSAGNYHVDVSCAQVGVYHYRFAATGTGQAAVEGAFTVKPSAFTA